MDEDHAFPFIQKSTTVIARSSAAFVVCLSLLSFLHPPTPRAGSDSDLLMITKKDTSLRLSLLHLLPTSKPFILCRPIPAPAPPAPSRFLLPPRLTTRRLSRS